MSRTSRTGDGTTCEVGQGVGIRVVVEVVQKS